MKPICFALWILAAGCRGDGRAPERVRPGTAGGGGAGDAQIVQPAGSDAPEAPPPGDDKLGPPPERLAETIALKEVARGLDRPVLISAAPDDARRRLFVVEQRGSIRILEGGKLLPKRFLTIGKLADGNEQGLLGLAFHPRFAVNRKLYVNFTTADKATHIVEYTTAAADPDAVDPATRRDLAVIAQPYSNHNGGHLEFGPDGKLYVGMGDGGAANDPHGNGQNDKALLGKLLRLDVDAERPTPEIVHKGLRNPWRFTFDRKTGDLYLGDVGQNLWEYVFGVAAGDRERKNFGWNIVEGSHCFDAATGGAKRTCDKAGLTPPLVEYSHDEGCSITGGVVYRGKALPALDGRYFYADYCTGLLRSFVWTRGVVRDHWNWKPAIDRKAVLGQISSFGLDADGEVYIVELTGSIYQLVPASR